VQIEDRPFKLLIEMKSSGQRQPLCSAISQLRSVAAHFSQASILLVAAPFIPEVLFAVGKLLPIADEPIGAHCRIGAHFGWDTQGPRRRAELNVESRAQPLAINLNISAMLAKRHDWRRQRSK
jgi:hypothetical protein